MITGMGAEWRLSLALMPNGLHGLANGVHGLANGGIICVNRAHDQESQMYDGPIRVCAALDPCCVTGDAWNIRDTNALSIDLELARNLSLAENL